MDEKDFELMEVLGESKNITKAAEKLFISQSALSKRIKSIERELGIELLLRCHQGIRFTPPGKRCWPIAGPPQSSWSRCVFSWILSRSRFAEA